MQKINFMKILKHLLTCWGHVWRYEKYYRIIDAATVSDGEVGWVAVLFHECHKCGLKTSSPLYIKWDDRNKGLVINLYEKS